MSIRHWTLRTTSVLLALLVAVVAVPAAAWAFWTAGAFGAGTATTGTLNPPAKPAASASGTAVTLSWTKPDQAFTATLAYRVLDDRGTTVCGASAPVTATTCGYTASPGTYSYRVVAVHESWTATSAASAPLTVTAPISVTVSAASPSVVQGTTRTVTVTGSGFASGATVSASTAGITVGTTTFVGATSLTVPVTVAASVAPGSYDLTVANTDGGTATGKVLTVTLPPTITNGGITPSSLPQGASRTVTISGTNFQQGATVAIGNTGSRIATSGVSVNSLTSITVTVTVDSMSPVESRVNVTVTNPDGGTASRSNSFAVTPGPQVTSTISGTNTSPATVARGSSAVVTVNGSGFTSGMTLSFGAPGITTSGFQFVSATQVKVTVTVAASGVPTGSYSLTVTNGDGGTSTKTQALTVT